MLQTIFVMGTSQKVLKVNRQERKKKKKTGKLPVKTDLSRRRMELYIT